MIRKNAPGPGEIHIDMAPRLLMQHPRRIRQLQAEGWIAKTDRPGIFTVQSAVQGYINFLKDEGRRTSRANWTQPNC